MVATDHQLQPTEVYHFSNTYNDASLLLANNRYSITNICADVDAIVSAASLHKHEKILDMCCGLGRHSLELARRGYSQVIGFDHSSVLAGRATAKHHQTLPEVPLTYHLGDARNIIEFKDSTFDKILLLGNSLAYFAPADRLRVLQELGRLLTTNGTLLMDVINVEYANRNPHTWNELENDQYALFDQRVQNDGKLLVTAATLLSHDKGFINSVNFSETLFSYSEIHALLEQSGFKAMKSLPNAEKEFHYLTAQKGEIKIAPQFEYPVEVRTISYGKGGFAARDIKEGEIVHRFSGSLLPYSKISKDLKIYSCWAWELPGCDGGIQVVSNNDAIYVNHACEPNCRLSPSKEIVAARDIKQGEELSFVYCFSDYYDYWDPVWTFECKCGSLKCLGLIDGYFNKNGTKLVPPVRQ